MTVAGQIVDVVSGRVFSGRIEVESGRVKRVVEDSMAPRDRYYCPGFVDAHIHIESSMIAPSAFARIAPVHGTVATVSDPHEIANVLGESGVRWMIENGNSVPFKFHFGAPSCVPATLFETAGARFDATAIAELLKMDGIHYLAEVMNFPAVIQGEPNMLAVIAEAKKRGMRIDGHAPGVTGAQLQQYVAAGIETDHECVTESEGRERIELGMKVAIREGSAARNFEALWPLIEAYPDDCFFCSDDKHPDDLLEGHIDALLRRSVAKGVDPVTALRVATRNPVQHYALSVGLLQDGDPADFIEIENLHSFRALRTWIDGELVAEGGQTKIEAIDIECPNLFRATEKQESQFVLNWDDPSEEARIIIAENGQLVTGSSSEPPLVVDGNAVADPSRDCLKMAVVNRYADADPALGFVRNFGLQSSAIASSVAHDSHNVVAVGASDALLCEAVNEVIRMRGGLSYVDASGEVASIPLPIAGLMSDQGAAETAEAFTKLTEFAQSNGCHMRSPYMTLSFMALLVIPSLKLGDKGLFDIERFQLVSIKS